jgi:hypothetical protein
MVINPGASRTTHAIKQVSIARVLNGVNFAQRQSLPLNTAVTINLWQTHCPEGQESAAFARLRDTRFTPFIRREQKKIGSPGVPPTYVWTLENVGGVHCHWLLHIPRHRFALFAEKLPLWIEAVTGGITDKSCIHIQEAHNPVGKAKYILKGADPFWATTYNIDAIDQGPVIGKRAGTSENIGKAARLGAVRRGEAPPLARINRKRPVPSGSHAANLPPSMMRA